MLLLFVRVQLWGHHRTTVLVAEPTRYHVHVLHTLASRNTAQVLLRMLMTLWLLLLLLLEWMSNVRHRRRHHLVQPETLLSLSIAHKLLLVLLLLMLHLLLHSIVHRGTATSGYPGQVRV